MLCSSVSVRPSSKFTRMTAVLVATTSSGCMQQATSPALPPWCPMDTNCFHLKNALANLGVLLWQYLGCVAGRRHPQHREFPTKVALVTTISHRQDECNLHKVNDQRRRVRGRLLIQCVVYCHQTVQRNVIYSVTFVSMCPDTILPYMQSNRNFVNNVNER